eukprot:jgi/Astpho2/1228/Aster-07079
MDDHHHSVEAHSLYLFSGAEVARGAFAKNGEWWGKLLVRHLKSCCKKISNKSLNLLITGIPKVTAVRGFLDDQALRKLAASGNLRTFDVA